VGESSSPAVTGEREKIIACSAALEGIRSAHDSPSGKAVLIDEREPVA
jgi:hypothetical protein